MTMRLINLTNDPIISFLKEDGSFLSIEREDGVRPARIRSHQIELVHDPIPIKVTILDGIDDLPDPADDTLYICSYLVAVYANRVDVVCPNQFPGESIIHKGNLVACRSLQAFEVKL
jgi:hypothetical protein